MYVAWFMFTVLLFPRIFKNSFYNFWQSLFALFKYYMKWKRTCQTIQINLVHGRNAMCMECIYTWCLLITCHVWSLNCHQLANGDHVDSEENFCWELLCARQEFMWALLIICWHHFDRFTKLLSTVKAIVIV